MEITKILEDDFIKILEEYDFSALKEKSIFITGATGLMGSILIKFLLYINEVKNYKIKIYGLIRSKDKAERVFGVNCRNITFIEGDIQSLSTVTFDIDYIIHGASITSSKSFVENPVETIDIAINGTKNMLELAYQKKVKAFLYLSSMEVYGVTDGKSEVREPDLGYINILNPRSSYSESKRMCECICTCYASEYKVPAKIIRLTQTFGTGIDYNDSRVAAQFARAVIEKHDIVLKTKGKTKRPVLYTSDAISAVFTVLLKGKIGEAYTAANPKTFVTIRETAELIAEKIAENRIKVIFDILNIASEYAPVLNLNLNIDKLLSLGWKPTVDLEEAYRRMIMDMKFRH